MYGKLTDFRDSDYSKEQLESIIRQCGQVIENLSGQLRGLDKVQHAPPQVIEVLQGQLAEAQRDADYWKERADALEFDGKKNS